MNRLIKPYLTIVTFVMVLLLGIQYISGMEISFIETGIISIIASLIVMSIWFIVGYLICVPLVRLLHKIFFAMR